MATMGGATSPQTYFTVHMAGYDTATDYNPLQDEFAPYLNIGPVDPESEMKTIDEMIMRARQEMEGFKLTTSLLLLFLECRGKHC